MDRNGAKSCLINYTRCANDVALFDGRFAFKGYLSNTSITSRDFGSVFLV